MFHLVRKAKRQKVFFKATSKQRVRDERDYESNKTNIPPAFNKRLYSVQGSGTLLILFLTFCYTIAAFPSFCDSSTMYRCDHVIAEGVVITGASMKIMIRNEANVGRIEYRLSKSELMVMRTVVEGGAISPGEQCIYKI